MSAKPVVRGDPQSIASYYEETWLDYRMLWLNPSNRAIHFGYWDETTRNHSDSLVNMNRVLAGNLRPQAGQRVLDCGCGVGGTAMWLAEHHDVEVVGITVTPDQVVRATRYAAERGLQDKVRFALQDYTRMALPDATFDLAYGLESINYAPSKRQYLSEVFRVLKPGGRMVVQDGFRVDRALSPAEHRLQESWLEGWLVPNLSSLPEFAQYAAEVGFVDVEQRDCTASVTRSCRRLYRITMACYPIAASLHLLGARSDVQHGNVRAARDQYRAMRRGLWGYGIVAANKP
jgi:cyclopropane fatty-acyl-phospholipid synthase-like methyltransferase